jgi:hypothetical protein
MIGKASSNAEVQYAAAPGRRKVALALQGGGSHGAFTWGVLDRLLDDETIEIIGVTGTSAGAMNGDGKPLTLGSHKMAMRSDSAQPWTCSSCCRGAFGTISEFFAALSAGLIGFCCTLRRVARAAAPVSGSYRRGI